MRRLPILCLLILTAVAALAIACGSDNADDGTPTPTATEADTSATPTPGTDDGTPTPVGTPTLTSGNIELDEFVIRPGLTRARPGAVTFNVTNAGELTHDFLRGILLSEDPLVDDRNARVVDVLNRGAESVGRAGVSSSGPS